MREAGDKIGHREGVKLTDKQVNQRVSESLGVTEEAVRQWRKSKITPRRQQIEGLVKFLQDSGVSTTPEYLERGLSKGLTPMELRERIADDGDELDLLRLFRASNRRGKELILENAQSLQLSHPQGHNVKSLHQHRKHRKR